MRLAALSLLSGFAICYAQVNVSAIRMSRNPILGPEENNHGEAWSAKGRFNPAAIRVGRRTVLLFRALDAGGTSRIGYAVSEDGLHFNVRPEPVLSPEAEYEKGGGVEDPRVVRIGSTYYMTYTAYNGRDAQLCLATSPDLLRWDRKGVIMPAYRGKWNTQWTKSGAIVPRKIQGKWWMYYMGNLRDSDGKSRDYMGVATSGDLLHWTDATERPVLQRRPGAFDSRVMEPGPSPILTSEGVLLLYNGADEALIYGPGWILFDAHDPTKVIARAEKPFLLPELAWEKNGQVPNVVFLEGAVPFSGSMKAGKAIELTGYYGAADRYVGAMRLSITVR